MKVKWRKKQAREQLGRKGKTCPKCGESIEASGHYIPALDEWLCVHYKSFKNT